MYFDHGVSLMYFDHFTSAHRQVTVIDGFILNDRVHQGLSAGPLFQSLTEGEQMHHVGREVQFPFTKMSPFSSHAWGLAEQAH